MTVKGTYICNGSFNTDYYRFDIFAAGFSKKGITIKEKCTIDASEIWKGDLLEHPAAWMSSCDPVASVDPQSGKITVKAAGTAVIYACFAFGEDQAKVYRFVIRAAKIGGLRCYSKTLKYGAVFSTKVINTDKDTAITWFLDGDEDRADFVDKEKGIIKLNSMIYDDEPLLLHAQAGEEVYTCTLSCKQPVLKGVPKDYDEKDYVLLRKGRTRQLSVKNIAKGVNVDWSSTDTDVVTVSRTGKVRAKGYGDATVKVKVAGYNDDDIDAYSIGFWVPDPKPDYDW